MDLVSPRTSVVICARDMAAYLEESVESALSQDDDSFECLVLDDGSSDETWSLLARFKSDPRVRLFRNERAEGLTAGRNRLLSEARGRYLSILDADDSLAPGKLSRHAALLDARPEVGVVWGRAIVSSLGDPQELWHLVPPENYEPGWDLTSSYQAAHSATTWRKAAIERVGGYDPRWTLVEAVDLFLKVGDFAEQAFCPTLAAFKRIDPESPFRRRIKNEGAALSRELLRATLRRRYGATAADSLLQARGPAL